MRWLDKLLGRDKPKGKITVQAKVKRVNGKVEDLGTVAEGEIELNPKKE